MERRVDLSSLGGGSKRGEKDEPKQRIDGYDLIIGYQSTLRALKAFAAVVCVILCAAAPLHRPSNRFRSAHSREGRAQAVFDVRPELLETPDREQWQRTDDISTT